jgi:membrane protein
LVAGDGAVGALLAVFCWPALLAGAIAGLATLYRHGPCRAEPRWRWVSWGGVFAAVAWVIGSAVFSWYARRLGGYGAAYGPLAAVVAFMTWAWLSAAAVLLGAVLNVEAECQTARDTTAGPERPQGAHDAAETDRQRGASGAVESALAASNRGGVHGDRNAERQQPQHNAERC